MGDVHTRAVRSYNMSRIKGKNTAPEMQVRKFLFANGFRYRLHDKRLPCKPDVVLPKIKTVIFIHGCFWHGHTNCKYFVVPKTRTKWWKEKIQGNIDRDFKNYLSLKEQGWKIITVWECELKSEKRNKRLTKILSLLS